MCVSVCFCVLLLLHILSLSCVQQPAAACLPACYYCCLFLLSLNIKRKCSYRQRRRLRCHRTRAVVVVAAKKSSSSCPLKYATHFIWRCARKKATLFCMLLLDTCLQTAHTLHTAGPKYVVYPFKLVYSPVRTANQIVVTQFALRFTRQKREKEKLTHSTRSV